MPNSCRPSDIATHIFVFFFGLEAMGKFISYKLNKANIAFLSHTASEK